MNGKTPDLLYGREAIANHLGLTLKQCCHRIDSKHIPTFKMGRTVCASRVVLDTWISEIFTAAKEGKTNV